MAVKKVRPMDQRTLKLGRRELHPVDAAEIITAINTDSQAGDIVVIPVGTFDCSATVLEPKAGVRITGKGSANSIVTASLNISLTGTQAVVVKKLAIVLTGLADVTDQGPIECSGGYHHWSDVAISGEGSGKGNGITAMAMTKACHMQLRNVTVTDVKGDGVSCQASNTEGARFGALSKAELFSCIVTNSGAGGTDQCVTTHAAFPLYCYDCTFTKADDSKYVFGQGLDYASKITKAYFYRCTCVGQLLDAYWIEDCVLAPPAAVYAVKYTAACTEGFFLLATDIDGTTGSGGVQHNTAATVNIESCWIHDFDDADEHGLTNYSSGHVGTGALNLVNNRIDTCRDGLDIYQESTPGCPILFKNNIVDASTRYSILTREGAGLAAVWTAANNVINGGSILGNGAAEAYVPVASDITAAAPALGADGTPTAAGNCDANGDATVTFTSAYDVLGQARKPGTTVCRGPIERQ